MNQTCRWAPFLLLDCRTSKANTFGKLLAGGPLGEVGKGCGLWAVLPGPKRALRAHRLPLWGRQAQAHLTLPATTRLVGGAHGS